ncbi:MAG: FHA domain-containing protein [Pirellulaceae bacterium]
MIVKLVSQDALASPQEFVLDRFPADLGRSADVEVRIDDRWLSRRHCRLELSDGVLLVRDLGSRHGTFVNGQIIAEARLLPGSLLSIGLSHFVAQYDLSPAESRLAAAAQIKAVLA